MRIRVTGEVVKIFDIEVDTGSQAGYDDLRFRIEFIVNEEKPDVTMVRIWRKEFYRLQPTFPQEGYKPKPDQCDELILVEETSILDSEAFVAKDWKTVLALVINKLEERFNV